MVLLNSGNELDADDVFQDSLIILYRKVRDEDFRLSSSLKTYLYAICRNKWLKELSRREKMTMLTQDDEFTSTSDDNSIEEEILYEERERIYREKYEELSEDCKKILKMYAIGSSITEITKIMGFSSEQHTRNRRFKCKESLIQRIKKINLKMS
jgi:RNA polymerase sigma factor (sigma-70 family)